jgi:hypothetical protein
MKVIPETSRAQYIKYLYFHEYHWMDTYVAELISPRGIILPHSQKIGKQNNVIVCGSK